MKPFRPSALRAFFTASAHSLALPLAQVFMARTDIFFDTTLPPLFLTRSFFVSPPAVFSFRPERTEDLARVPLAIFDTTLAFMLRLAFLSAVFALNFVFGTAFLASIMAGTPFLEMAMVQTGKQ